MVERRQFRQATAIATASKGGYHGRVPASSSMALALTLVLAWRQDGLVAADHTPHLPPAPTHTLVTAVAPLDAQRLADALHAYLQDEEIRVVTLPADKTDGLRQQFEDARRLGREAQATTVVRVERDVSDGPAGDVEIELVDLTTDEVVIATVVSPARDEDRYRALALKIQALLRARWSSTPGVFAATEREVGGPETLVSSRFAPGRPSALVLDVGLAVVSFPVGGPSFEGVDMRAWWLPSERIALTVGTALLGSAGASRGDVDVSATMVPIRATTLLRLAKGRAALFAGPSAELSLLRVAATSATTPVRSVGHVMFALGGEADARLALAGPLSLFARAAALGILNGESYQVAGVPLIDTSRFELTGTLGVALDIP